jgi:hypothetical protein
LRTCLPKVDNHVYLRKNCNSERARMPVGFCKLDAIGQALLVGFGLAERLPASTLVLFL